MVCIRTMFAILLLFPAAVAFAADWQYAGIVGRDQASFFDAADIRHPDPDTVRIWVKDIPEKTIRGYFKSRDGDRVMDEAAGKIASRICARIPEAGIKQARVPGRFQDAGRIGHDGERRDHCQ